MGRAPVSDGELGNLRMLRRLVTLLTITMIIGLLAIVSAVVIQINRAPAPLVLPRTITLPAGTRLQAFTRGDGWVAVVTRDNEILIYDAASGRLRQRVAVAPAAPAERP